MIPRSPADPHRPEPGPAGAQQRPVVLVVEDDDHCRDEYVATLEALGHEYLTASSGEAALALIERNPRIGIVVTDINMPGMTGMTLLSEMQRHRHAARPIAAMVVTGHGNMNMAVSAMRLDAVDFLMKPVRHGDFLAGLDRAMRSWSEATERSVQARFEALRGEISRVAELLDLKQGVDSTVVPASLGNETPDARRRRLEGLFQAVVASRRQRSNFLPGELFADPAWDILIDLALARLQNKSVAVSSACIAAGVPMSTALRWIREMTTQGLLIREQDPNDRRRDFVRLPDHVMERMVAYIESAADAWRRADRTPARPPLRAHP